MWRAGEPNELGRTGVVAPVQDQASGSDGDERREETVPGELPVGTEDRPAEQGNDQPKDEEESRDAEHEHAASLERLLDRRIRRSLRRRRVRRKRAAGHLPLT